MRRILGFLFVIAACLGSTGTASAAPTYTLCLTGAGKPLVAPAKSGKCKAGEQAIRLARASALSGLQRQVDSLKSKNSTLSAHLNTLKGGVSTLKSTLSPKLNTLTGQVGTLDDTFSGVSRSGSTLRFSGMNLQLESGSGATDGTVNGLGNLIIGYNENPGAVDQTGSHNLVLGNQQAFTSYGGIIAGQVNTLSGPYSDVFGTGNTASGLYSSVSGGIANTASGDRSSVSGGSNNTASGSASSVIGGSLNRASGDYSTERGGQNQTASADLSYFP